jgi:threonine aldolase
MISFASDNTARAHPRVIEALARANAEADAPAYGADPWTGRAERKLAETFGSGARAFLVFNGTAANVLGISALVRPHESVLTAECSHLINDECGAIERFSGVTVQGVPAPGGKLTPEALQPYLGHKGDPHHVQPRLVSVSQTTELGTVYSAGELRALAEFAHGHELLLHVDGARFANAAAAQGLTLARASNDLGVDVLSFGGTKNGLVFGEAVVFFRRPEARDFPYVRKQGLNLASKMRFVAAQFLELVDGDPGSELWLENARHANAMAARLAERVRGLRGAELAQPVQANALFVKLPPSAITALQKEFHFYVWDPAASLVRWMTSFQTRAEDVDALAEATARVLGAGGR